MIKLWLDYIRKGLSRKLPQDRISKEKVYPSLKANLKNLFPFLKKHWRKGALGVILIILMSLLSFPHPLITKYLIDNVILSKQLHLLAGAILLLVGITVIQRLTGVLEGFTFARFEQTVILDIQEHVLERALRFPKSFFDANQTGYLMSRLSSDVQSLRWFFSSTIVYIISNIFRFIGGLILLFYLEWRLALGVFAVLPILLFSSLYFSKKVRVLSHQSRELNANLSSRFQESLTSVSLIKAFATETRTIKRIISSLKSSFRVSLEQSTVNALANIVTSAAPSLARVVVLALGAIWIINGEWTLGSLLAFQAYLGYVFGPASSLASTNLQLQGVRASLERVSALFEIVPEETGKGKKVDHLKGNIEFKNVTFSYDHREPVLRDLSFRVRPGGHVAIVGPSGVGKTTLLSLILRFYKPASGEICFDGHPAAFYELSSLRQRIGYVSQSTLLLSGSIMENIRYGSPEAADEDVVRVAQAAGIHYFIQSLPDKYETKLGERGVNLSGGQKQRLSIARALLKDPDILILDEPTSALDPHTEKSIFESLPKVIKDKTLLIVSSRLSTIKKTEHILLLNESRLIATGTHESLWKTNEYYRSLIADQLIKTGNQA